MSPADPDPNSCKLSYSPNLKSARSAPSAWIYVSELVLSYFWYASTSKSIFFLIISSEEFKDVEMDFSFSSYWDFLFFN